MAHFVCFDIFLILLSVFFPPIPVAVKAGLCSADFFINIALCCLGYFPGLIHAWYIIAKYPEVIEIDLERQSLNQGHVHHTYITISSPPPTPGASSNQQPYQDQPPSYTAPSTEQQGK
jgi:uncharacterized membrane protein YqaE (UPF0057 family)